jgi:hypothetical protein
MDIRYSTQARVSCGWHYDCLGGEGWGRGVGLCIIEAGRRERFVVGGAGLRFEAAKREGCAQERCAVCGEG